MINWLYTIFGVIFYVIFKETYLKVYIERGLSPKYYMKYTSSEEYKLNTQRHTCKIFIFSILNILNVW